MRSLRALYDELVDVRPVDRPERMGALELSADEEQMLRAMLDVPGDLDLGLASNFVDQAIETLGGGDEVMRALMQQRIGGLSVLDLVGEGDDQQVSRWLRAAAAASLTLGELSDGSTQYEDLLVLQRARFGGSPLRIGADEAALSRVFRRFGDAGRAETHARAALAKDRKTYGDDDRRVALRWSALSLALAERRRYGEALKAGYESLRVLGASDRRESAESAALHAAVGLAHTWCEEFSAAVACLRVASAHSIAASGLGSAATARICGYLGFVLAHLGDWQEGAAEIDRAISRAERLPPPDVLVVAPLLHLRARAAIDAGDAEAALAAIDRLGRMADRLAQFPRWPGGVNGLRAEALLALGRVELAQHALDAADGELSQARWQEPELAAALKLWRAETMRAAGDESGSCAEAGRGRALLATVPKPPRRLIALAASLPRCA